MSTLKDLKDRIQGLEAEKVRLSGEVENLKRAAEARVAALEGQIGQMREEAKTLRGLLTGS
jgi:predicted  nucleic acid-binding Zn-ribbon protein